jgi:hypothetical protein
MLLLLFICRRYSKSSGVDKGVSLSIQRLLSTVSTVSLCGDSSLIVSENFW